MTGGYDLLVAGAAHKKGVLKHIQALAEPTLIEKAECSVLILSTPQARTHQGFQAERISSIGPAFSLVEHLIPECVEAHIKTERKDQLFMRIAEHFHKSLSDIPTETIYQALQDRERTQNTALGQGLALPHASINNLSRNYVGIFTTASPIAYGTTDGEKIDVFIATIGSIEDRNTHLKILASVARMVNDTDVLARLRTARTSTELVSRFHECHDKVQW